MTNAPRDVAILLSALLAGCPSPRARERATPDRPAATRADATAADASADAPPTAPDTAPDAAEPSADPPLSAFQAAASWQDPAALDALAQDCHVAAPAETDGPPGVLSCESDMEAQACTANPCYGRSRDACRGGCRHRCASCDVGCRAGCDRCRAPCRDDACRRACAASCGACLTGCLADKDRCFTGVCNARDVACTRRYARAFRARCFPACSQCERDCPEEGDGAAEACRSGCAARGAEGSPPWSRCMDDCNGRLGRAACIERCLARRGGCTAQDRSVCTFESSSFAEEADEPGDAGAP